MVTYTTTPVYGLELVRELASVKNADFRSRKAYERCQQSLGLSLDQVCDHISTLCHEEYRKTHHYGQTQAPDDSYVIHLTDGYGRYVQAYIKICISYNGIFLDIGSFHGTFDGWE